MKTYDGHTPEHTKAQELFLNFFHEALRFLRCVEDLVEVCFEDYSYIRIPSTLNSGSIFPPMIPDYENNKLQVTRDWPEAIVEDMTPTNMRMIAYYYAYGFYQFNKGHIIIEQYPQNKEARDFSIGLGYLNGVPSPISDENTREIGKILYKLTGKKFKFDRGITADGNGGYILVKDDSENSRLGIRFKTFQKIAASRRLKIEKGTEENPFDNIDEAIKYIERLEKDEVDKDPFLNSELITDEHRYDFGFIPKRGYEMAKGFYKIPWASAYTAHYPNDFPKHSFVVTQLTPTNDDRWLNDEKVEKFCPLFAMKPNLSRRRFLFRGQTEEYKDRTTGKPICAPNIYREDKSESLEAGRIKAYEMACLATRHPLVEQLGVKGVKIFNEPFKFQLNLLGLAQHYYNKTEFLDLTSDINTAKFFATTKYKRETDRYEEYFSEEKLGVLYIYDMRLPGEFSHTTLPQLSCIGKQYLFQRSAMQSGFLLKMPKGLHLHELPNVYRIYFRHDAKISKDVIVESDGGKKYFPNDALSRQWKRIKDKPNETFTISRKSREMYFTLHRGEVGSLEEVDEIVKKEGFRLGDNRWPEFEEEILNEYYAESLKAWEEFCSDIYFSGAEGYFMKKAMLELPQKSEYWHAFYKN